MDDMGELLSTIFMTFTTLHARTLFGSQEGFDALKMSNRNLGFFAGETMTIGY
jgi:hypothetical protein